MYLNKASGLLNKEKLQKSWKELIIFVLTEYKRVDYIVT